MRRRSGFTDGVRMRVLVTGASGYLGQHLVARLLADGHAVTALVRDPARLGDLQARPGVRVQVADLSAAVSIDWSRHDACVHAALIWGAPGTELEMRDAAATAALFDGAGRAGIQRAVYLSSTAVHRPFSGQMTEADPIAPTDLYGATKATGELLLAAACGTHGMVVRAGPIVGPPAIAGGPLLSPGAITRMLDGVLRGAPVRIAEGAGRQLVGARAVARTVSAALVAPSPPAIVLCVAERATRWVSVAQRLIELTGSASRIDSVDGPGEPAEATFVVDRLTALIGERLDSDDALAAHLGECVARAGQGAAR